MLQPVRSSTSRVIAQGGEDDVEVGLDRVALAGIDPESGHDSRLNAWQGCDLHVCVCGPTDLRTNRLVFCPGGVCADGEDSLGSGCGADRALVAPGVAGIEPLGSAHDEGELEALKVAARQRFAAGQAELDLGLSVSEAASSGGPLEIASSRMAHLWDALCRAYEVLGFDKATGGDVVFRDLVLARIIEPTSKEDSIRVLSEAGVAPASYRTIKRRLPGYAEDFWRERLAAACAQHAALGPKSLVLYDVSSSTSRPTTVTGSGSRGSPKNAAWSRRS